MPLLASIADYFCFNRKFLIYNLIMRNLKIRYRKSLLGMMWTVLIPAGSAGIFYVVLKNIMKVQQPNHFVLILSSQIAWVFLATTVTVAQESIVSNFSLLNKVPLPPHSLVLAETLTLLLNLLLSLPILFLAMAFIGPWPTWAFLQYFVLLGLLTLITYSGSMLLALTYVYLRDLKHLMALILQFWFYLTPVLYSEEMVPENYRWMLVVNPVGKIFVGLQRAVRGVWLESMDWLVILIWVSAIVISSQVLLRNVRSKVVEIA